MKSLLSTLQLPFAQTSMPGVGSGPRMTLASQAVVSEHPPPRQLPYTFTHLPTAGSMQAYCVPGQGCTLGMA